MLTTLLLTLSRFIQVQRVTLKGLVDRGSYKIPIGNCYERGMKWLVIVITMV